ncbi:MAG TPA: hypothetical protein VN812_04895 [Candidatus Acidoferrales bacterium]|nr:hypothetical protein [Candidatus Acidoferrales bacterium]
MTAAEVVRRTGYSYTHVRHLASLGELPVVAVINRRAPLFDERVITAMARRRAKLQTARA